MTTQMRREKEGQKSKNLLWKKRGRRDKVSSAPGRYLGVMSAYYNIEVVDNFKGFRLKMFVLFEVDGLH